MLEILKRNLEDFTAGRWDSLKAGLADNVVYEELATGIRVQGPDEFIAVLQRWRRAFPDVKCTIHSGFEAADRVVAEVEWQGTHSGTFESPFGTIQATNKRGTARAAIVATLKDGKLVEEHHYFDMLKLLTQLGIAPGVTMPQSTTKAASAAAAPKA